MLAASQNFIPRQPPLIHKTVTTTAPRQPASNPSSRPAPAATPAASAPAPTPKQPPSTLCRHLGPLVKTSADASSHFALGVRWSLRLASGGQASSAKRRKLEPPMCRVCSHALSRPLLCLDCGLTLCGSRDGADHAKVHAKEKGHELFLDLHSRAVFCFPCSDYVYHPVLECIISLQVVAHEEAYAIAVTPAGAKRKRVPFRPWKATTPTTSVLSPTNPRGLRNLGQTCYMSVILQSFLHNPLLRSYFLSDGHNALLCPRRLSGEKGCLSCAMDRLFTESYSTDGSAFGPTSVLYSVWKSSVASELSGYAQQDAHEFLISAMNLLHSSSPGSTNSHCNCIIHQTFSGQLRSEVRCGKCSNVTTSSDPFLDLSLDLRGGRKPGAMGEVQNSLAACLARFTSPEQLPPNEYTCAACGDASHAASKRLGISKLPPVLCIQLKRFEHSVGSHKIDMHVRFPLKLNMRPYTTAAISSAGSTATAAAPSSMFEYELSSVVCHEGKLDNGHYTCFCRAVDDFYFLDDDKVRRAPLAEVLASKAFLLTYTKRTLPYAEDK